MKQKALLFLKSSKKIIFIEGLLSSILLV